MCIVACFLFASICSVIGKTGNVELISPVNPKGPVMMKWKVPEVLSGSSSPLYYNITVREFSMQVIAQSTTMDTSYAINSDLLVPCDSYKLNVIPFQLIFNQSELGITTQTAKNYSGSMLAFAFE